MTKIMAESPGHALFDDLDSDELQRLLPQLRLKQYQAGQYIFQHQTAGHLPLFAGGGAGQSRLYRAGW